MLGTRRAAALTAATTLIVTTAGIAPASAAVWRHSDAREDVVRVDTTDGDSYHKAPGNRTSDITKIAVRHTTSRVILRTEMRNVNGHSGEVRYRVRTDERRFNVAQYAGELRRAARPAPYYIERANGSAVDCPGVESSVSWRHDAVRISIPRSCLDTPAWVRVGGAVVDDNPDGQVFADSAKVKGFPSGTEDADDLLVLGPRVHRG